MNITLTANGKFYMFDLARELHARGALTAIYTSYPRFKLRDEGLPDSKVRTFPYVHAPYMAFKAREMLGARILQRWEWEAKLSFDRHVARNLPAQIDVLAGMSGSTLASGRAAQARGARYVCERASAHIRTQDRILREEYDRWGIPFEGIDLRVIEREEEEYAQADAVAVPSNFVVRSFAEHGVPASKVHRLPLGVDLTRYRSVATPQAGRFDVVFVAAMLLQKGVPYLLQAYRRLQHPNKSLSLVGAPSRPLIDHMRRLGLWSDDVNVLGFIPHAQLLDRLSRSHVLVLPSVQEGLAGVQAQAMACGCPVIGTTHSGAEDLYDDGVEGFIVPAGESDRLTERMQWMADHPQERAAMGVRSLDRVRRIGGWADYGDAAMGLYRRLTSGGRSAADDVPASVAAA